MKTLILFSFICFVGCTKIEYIIEPVKTATETSSAKAAEANISIDYEFVRSGNMAKSESTYLDFYNKYIVSKMLTPRTYEIQFSGVNTNGPVTAKGVWGSKMLVALPPDRYIVSGISHPTKYPVCGDTCYLKFHDTIDITQTSTNITLKAYYDCSLILLDTTDVKSTLFFATNWSFYTSFQNAVKTTMMETENLYHSFYSNGPANGDGYDKTELYLNVVSRRTEPVFMPPTPMNPNPPTVENKSTTIVLWLYTWTAGKYYYFENTSDVYNLTPMTGN